MEVKKEEIMRGKRDYRGFHLKHFEIKSEIILALMDRPLTFDVLFEKIDNTYKTKYGSKINKKKISRKDLKYHLYDEEYGLTRSKNGKVIISKNGKLSLNITDPVSLAKMIDYLMINDEYGLKIQRSLDLVFIACVMSPYGDFPFENNKFFEYFLSKDKKLIKLSYIYDFIKNNGDIQSIKLLSINDNEINIALDAIKSIRGEINTYFKVAYILRVMEISKNVENLEVNLKKYLEIFMLHSYTLFPLSKDQIEQQARWIQEDIVKEFFENVIIMTIKKDDLKFTIYTGFVASRFDQISEFLKLVLFLAPKIDPFKFMIDLDNPNVYKFLREILKMGNIKIYPITQIKNIVINILLNKMNKNISFKKLKNSNEIKDNLEEILYKVYEAWKKLAFSEGQLHDSFPIRK